ncbi:amidase signature enzyme, partial [Thelephora ganbajun]
MRVLPTKPWGRLRYTHTSTRTYATLAELRNARINAFVHFSNGSEPGQVFPDGPLSGMTIAVKDNICTSDMPTTCSSLMLKDFSSPYDATVVQLLRTAGANIVGKTNCDEFGMGSLNQYSVHGPVINPFGESESRSAGGSSGGSAAAVAAGLCDVALGTDTGGSIRLPASYCGVIGLKPSYGLLSRWGVVSFADTLDCVGIIAKDIESAESVFDCLNIYDPRDPTAATQEVRGRALKSALSDFLDTGSLSGLRIGIPSDYFPRELHPSVVDPLRALLADLKAHGASIVPVSLPSTPYALSAYYVIASAEASSNLARYDGIQYGLHVETLPGSDKRKAASVYSHSRSRGFGPEVKRRILLGTYALTADAFDNYFLQAQRVRKLVRRDFDRVFRAPDV